MGSGKSSLLAALRGEVPLVQGSMALGSGPLGLHKGGVAYLSQQLWMMGGTIRDNILLGQPMDPARYLEVSAS